MAYYGTYTPRTSLRPGNYGLSPAHNTLPARSSRSDRSPGRTKTSSSYLSPYPTSWEPHEIHSRTSMSYGTTERIASSRAKRDSSYSRPHSYLGWTSSQDGYHRSSSPSYRYSEYGYMKDRSTDYRPRAHSPEFRPRAYTSRNTVWTDLSMRYQRTPKYSETYRSDSAYSSRYAFGDPTALDVGGWRARLAKQGYVASTVRKKTVLVPDLMWQYLDQDEAEEPEDGFVYRTSCGTCDESCEELNSVISRSKRMKLQVMAEKPSVTDIEIQVRKNGVQFSYIIAVLYLGILLLKYRQLS